MKMGLFARNKPLEYRQNPFAVLVNAIQIGAERTLEISRMHPFIDNHSRHVDILTQGVERMPAEEKAVEKCGLPLRSQWVGIVSRSHLIRDSFSKKVILAMVQAKDQVL